MASMDDHKATISLLTSRIEAKAQEVNKLKKLVNELCHEIGEPEPYQDVSDSTQSISQIRSDQFYGHPLQTAIRQYLEMRKAANLGAASVADIFSTVRKGGFKFDAKDDENAKNTIRMSLRKNSSIFHKLPNGEYGLLTWYPNAKPARDDDKNEAGDNAEKDKDAPKTDRSKAKAESKTDKAESDNKSENFLTNDQLRGVIFSMSGEFRVTDLDKAISEKFPNFKPRATAVTTLMYQLTQKGQLKIVVPRKGNKGATYIKA